MPQLWNESTVGQILRLNDHAIEDVVLTHLQSSGREILKTLESPAESSLVKNDYRLAYTETRNCSTIRHEWQQTNDRWKSESQRAERRLNSTGGKHRLTGLFNEAAATSTSYSLPFLATTTTSFSLSLSFSLWRSLSTQSVPSFTCVRPRDWNDENR